MPLGSLPIHQRLTVLLLMVSGVALLLVCIGFFTYEFMSFRQVATRNLATLGAVIADNSTAALAFYNHEDAREVLSALRAEPDVVAAGLYDRGGTLFAAWSADAAEGRVPNRPGKPGFEFTSGHLAGVLPVQQKDGAPLGYLYLESNLNAAYQRFRDYGLIAALVVLGSLLAAYLVARRLQQQISQPILALAAAARAVSEDRDYSRRVAAGGSDELGVANKAFNHMLDHIQAQLARLELLNRITHAIGERQTMTSIFDVVVRSLENDLPADFACICLYEPRAVELTVSSVGAKAAALLPALARPEPVSFPVDENGLARCVRGSLVYEPDVRESSFAFPRLLTGAGLRAVVFAPLLTESRVSGVLVIARCNAHSFSSASCEFLRQLSEHAGLAAHQAQLYLAVQQAYDDLRQTQQTVMQQERLRALGQMASGIAHDINNAISPVALYTESLLEREPNLSARARDYLATIQRAIDDVAQTVARMREFYRTRETQLQLASVDMNKLASQVLELTRARWSDQPQQQGAVIDVHTDLTPNLPRIMGVESEIRDALTNLIFNAVDAMPEGGVLTVRTRVLEPARENGQSAGQVCVEVGDSGIGMSEETRRRCLEPFFTTKGERGTGLGLPMVYGMVQRHNAEMDIDSERGQGTTVRLFFSVFTPTATQVVHGAPPRAEPRRLRILLIDDDPLLIKSLRDTLEADGHLITTADGGQAGIEAFLAAQKSGESFALVITDLGMPYVDGRKVAAAIKAASAATPILMLTGWGQRLLAEHDVPPHVDRLLNKPPRLHELRAALMEFSASPLTEK